MHRKFNTPIAWSHTVLRILRYGLIVLFLGYLPLAAAWNDVGHKLVARIAYQQLQPEVKRQVDDLIGVLQPFYPDTSASFIDAATWADQIKADVAVYNSWHYINLSSTGKTSIVTTQPHNAVWIIEQSTEILRNKKANRLQRALFLRFLIHVVGDIHQPLHCVSLYNQHFPHGDRGGNLYEIIAAHDDNLHGFWDAGLDLFRTARGKPLTNLMQATLARRIEEDYPLTAFTQQMRLHVTPASWAEEGREIATRVAYHTAQHKQPSAAYVNRGQGIVSQQLALAGYRLAALLNTVFA